MACFGSSKSTVVSSVSVTESGNGVSVQLSATSTRLLSVFSNAVTSTFEFHEDVPRQIAPGRIYRLK